MAVVPGVVILHAVNAGAMLPNLWHHDAKPVNAEAHDAKSVRHDF